MKASAALWMALFGCGVGLIGACTKPNPAATCADGRCIDPAFGYCDVSGAISGRPNTCIAVDCTPGELEACDGSSALLCSADGSSFDSMECPAGCDPASGCLPFCTAGMAMACANDQLTSCNAEGTATVTEPCSLGCASGEPRCLTFEPSNGLGAALADSASEADVVLPPGARIDADLGSVQDANGTAIPVKTVLVSQVGGGAIRVFEAGSFTMSDVTATGTNALAFVASGPITLSGRLAARASGFTAGPGARSSSTCNGGDSMQFGSGAGCAAQAAGTGGAGNHQQGGQGGANNPNRGGSLTAFSPLAGGCAGGTQRAENGTTIVARGGAGGGAIQLVSSTRVVLTDQGLIDVGGGGGQLSTGGGSGGVVIVETPELSISGPAAGVAANGGAGGGCGMTGPDATITTSPAAAPVCVVTFAGSGGTGSTAPGSGCNPQVENCNGGCGTFWGGGGGSVGRMRIFTKTGVFETTGNPILSVRVTTGMLNPK